MTDRPDGRPERREDVRRTVLVVGTDPDLLLLCRAVLEHAGLHVLDVAADPHVQQAVADAAPGLIVLCVGETGVSPAQLLADLANDPATARIPVIAVTGGAPDGHLDDPGVRSLSTGATEHLTSPASPLALTQAVADVFSSDPTARERRRLATLEHRRMLRPPG